MSIFPILRNVACCVLAALLGSLPARAQGGQGASMGMEVTKRKILIGEPFTLILKGNIPLKDYAGQLPPFPDTIPHFELLEKASMDTSRTASMLTVTYTARMTSFDSGHWVLPSMGFRVGKNILKTDSIGMDVLTVALQGNDYRDIHEIVEVEAPPFDWKPWAAGALGLALMAALVWYYLRNRKKRVTLISPYDSKLSPLDQALQGLKQIRESGYMDQGDPVSHYAGMYEVFRVFLARKFGLPVMSDTTGEILSRLQDGMLDREGLGRLAAVLRVSDAVKFAKYPSSQGEATEAIGTMEEIIRLLNQQSN